MDICCSINSMETSNGSCREALSERICFSRVAALAELGTGREGVWFTEGVRDPRITVIKVTPEDGYYWDTKLMEHQTRDGDCRGENTPRCRTGENDG